MCYKHSSKQNNILENIHFLVLNTKKNEIEMKILRNMFSIKLYF